MQVVERRNVARRAMAEEVNAYIKRVMRELRCPIFLRGRVSEEIREFLYSEIELEEALSELPADRLSFRIGEPRELAQAFAETCKYVRLRGTMPIWKKRLVAAALIVSVVAAALFAVRAVDQWAHNQGYWGNNDPPNSFSEMSDPAALFDQVE